MKDYKFRGLDAKGKWVYGDLVCTTPFTDGHITSWIKKRNLLGLGARSTPTDAFVEVKTETVGQFTGLQDATGKDIYEGDIASNSSSQIWSVVFNTDMAAFMIKNSIDEMGTSPLKNEWVISYGFEVIGNIHQNADLLEVTE